MNSLPSNWQTELSTIRERNEYAFNNSLFCDVEFSVVDSDGIKVTIPANKYILAVSSPVFEAMFYGHLAESKPTIDLPDCTKEGLQEMLRCVSTDEVKLTGDNVVEVLYLADKYIMPFLKEKCKNFIGPDDVLSVLCEVQKMSDEKLKEDLWEKVDRDTRQTLSSEAFLNVSREMLCQILIRDTLNINEVDLFRAVDRWVGERVKEQGLESNGGETKRSILGEEVIRLIRFPLMKEKEFAEVVLPCEILKNAELIELVQMFNKISPATKMFIGKKRHTLGCILIPKVRFGVIYRRMPNNPSQIAIVHFTANKTVNLVGVRMFGNCDSRYNVHLQIFINKQRVSFLSSTFESEQLPGDTYYGFTINLDKPVKLDPSVVCTVKAELTGPPSYHGESSEDAVTVDDVTITYVSDRNQDNKGQFPTLILQNT